MELINMLSKSKQVIIRIPGGEFLLIPGHGLEFGKTNAGGLKGGIECFNFINPDIYLSIIGGGVEIAKGKEMDFRFIAAEHQVVGIVNLPDIGKTQLLGIKMAGSGF